jgi:ABC-type lipopolysaccharide export system ATPase subunit
MSTPATELLELAGVTKRYGGIAALDDCRFRVAEGSMTGLIGPNGSGKTTAFNVVSGFVRPDAGVVRFAGREVRPEPARMCRAGLVRTFQQPRVFGALTALENVVVAGASRWWAAFTPRVGRRDRSRALELLEEFGLAGVADLPADRLSYGQRKLVELATVLIGGPRLVLLDGIPVEAPLDGTLIVMRNQDLPGVIGEVGSVLGRHGVNIANFALGRDGKGAIGVVNVDESAAGQIDDEIVSALAKVPAIKDVRVIRV